MERNISFCAHRWNFPGTSNAPAHTRSSHTGAAFPCHEQCQLSPLYRSGKRLGSRVQQFQIKAAEYMFNMIPRIAFQGVQV